MEYRRLGNSGLLVSELALGAGVFGGERSRTAPADVARSIIDRFLEAGGNHIDTADIYTGGLSEEIVGAAIKGRRDEIVLASKVRFQTGPGPNEVGLSRHHIIRGVEDSLRRLDTDVIDLLYMHCWDPLTSLEESLRAFDDLVTAGKVRYIGVSNFLAWQLMKALGISDRNGYHRFVAAQYQYSLVSRDVEIELIDLFESEGVSLVPWSPLAGGFLSGKYRRGQSLAADDGRLGDGSDDADLAWSMLQGDRAWDTVDAAQEVASGRGVPPATVSLAWVLQRPMVASVITGVRTPEQLESNLSALDVELNDDEIKRLDAAAVPPPSYSVQGNEKALAEVEKRAGFVTGQLRGRIL